MATMNISLPTQMKAGVEAQSADGRYSNSSDYVRALIRREQIRAEKIATMQKLVDEAYASGFSERTLDEIFEEARERAVGMAERSAAAFRADDNALEPLRAMVEEAERSGVSNKTVLEIFADAERLNETRRGGA